MKTKEMLYEWKSFLQKDMINEVSIKRFQEQHPEFDTSMFSPQLKGNTDYLDIINNSIVANQNHSANDYIEQFDFYKNSIEPNRNNQEFLTINIPGEDNPISLAGKLSQGSCTATYDDIQQFQQARMFTLGKGSKNKLANAYARVLEEASQNDFELIVDNSDWVVYYPKSIRGSIALARSYWDGSSLVYDNTFNPSSGYGKNAGTMKWCTSVSGVGNMFLNYHRRLNLHMYYCIKKAYQANQSDRKLCVSFSKTKDKVKISDNSTATVNADNEGITEEFINSCLSESIFESLVNDAKSPQRPEINIEDYYSSISLEQFIIMRNANEDNLEDFSKEVNSIFKHSKDKEKIKSYMLTKEKNVDFLFDMSKTLFVSEEDILSFINARKDSDYDSIPRVLSSLSPIQHSDICTSRVIDNLIEIALEKESISLLNYCIRSNNTDDTKINYIFENLQDKEDILIKLISHVSANKVTDEMFDKLYSLCIKKSHRGISFLVKSKRLSTEQISGVLEILEKGDDTYNLKTSLLTCEDLPLNIINFLINDDDFRIRSEASTHYSKIKHDIENNDLSYLKNKNRRYKLAFFKPIARKLLTPEILDILSNDDDFNVSGAAKRYAHSIKRSRMYETRLLENYIKSVLT